MLKVLNIKLCVLTVKGIEYKVVCSKRNIDLSSTGKQRGCSSTISVT